MPLLTATALQGTATRGPGRLRHSDLSQEPWRSLVSLTRPEQVFPAFCRPSQVLLTEVAVLRRPHTALWGFCSRLRGRRSRPLTADRGRSPLFRGGQSLTGHMTLCGSSQPRVADCGPLGAFAAFQLVNGGPSARGSLAALCSLHLAALCGPVRSFLRTNSRDRTLRGAYLC